LKLLFVIGFYPEITGGAEYQARIIAECLRRNYNDEILFISYGHEKDESCHIDGFRVYKLSVNTGLFEKMMLYREFCRKVKSIIENENPDIVYQRILNTFSYRISSTCKKNNIPFIVHVSDIYSIKFRMTPIGLLKKILFKRIIYNHAGIIAQTAEQVRLLNRVNVSPGLQQYNFHPAAGKNTKRFPDHKKIYWIGSFRKVKRVELFLDLAQYFSSERDIEFIIIGRTEPGRYGKEMQKRITKLANVTYKGQCANTQINEWLETEAFCLVNTSSSEGFSNTFIQAWLRGVPVVSLCADPDQMLNKYKIGLPCGASMSKLKSKLKVLISDRDLYHELSRNAAKISANLFTEEYNIPTLEQFLRSNLRRSS